MKCCVCTTMGAIHVAQRANDTIYVRPSRLRAKRSRTGIGFVLRCRTLTMYAGYEVLHDVLSHGSAKTNSSQAGGAQALDEFVPGRRVWMKNECENFLGSPQQSNGWVCKLPNSHERNKDHLVTARRRSVDLIAAHLCCPRMPADYYLKHESIPHTHPR